MVLDCIRVALGRAATAEEGGGTPTKPGKGEKAGGDDAPEDRGGGGSSRKKSRMLKKRLKHSTAASTAVAAPAISDELLRDVWRYLAAEHASSSAQARPPPRDCHSLPSNITRDCPLSLLISQGIALPPF